MSMLDIEIVKKYIRMADDGWQQGYDEQPAGDGQTYDYQQDGYMNTYDGFEPLGQDAPRDADAPAKKGLFGRKRK